MDKKSSMVKRIITTVSFIIRIFERFHKRSPTKPSHENPGDASNNQIVFVHAIVVISTLWFVNIRDIVIHQWLIPICSSCRGAVGYVCLGRRVNLETLANISSGGRLYFINLIMLLYAQHSKLSNNTCILCSTIQHSYHHNDTNQITVQVVWNIFIWKSRKQFLETKYVKSIFV